jgi:hypothetical protein
VDVTIRDAESADHSRAAELLSVAYAEYLRFGDEEPGWIDYVAEEVPDISSRSNDTLIVAEGGSAPKGCVKEAVRAVELPSGV